MGLECDLEARRGDGRFEFPSQILTSPFLPAHLSLSKEASWTVSGVALHASPGRGSTRPVLSRRLRGLSAAAPALRVLVFRNGAGSEGCEVAAAAGLVEQFLDLCTQKLQLTSTAKLLYDWEGNRVQDIGLVPPLDGCLQSSATPLRGPVWVSRGEWFSPAGAKVYIRGTVGALRGKLRPAVEYLAQNKKVSAILTYPKVRTESVPDVEWLTWNF
ncbi:hypothetical protein SKAU_G00315120 [Synaphobranchus kaupii]|uniref:DCDC1 second doublecortin-like domain-containing protein n=1 Tax=Synaphobranchus kaupii TaxID=118154 RepID=A0A9Q1ESE2_SYNKA|nr:hypothetical protein SKAU_G00315120 [Synaphobranchus kaupii]